MTNKLFKLCDSNLTPCTPHDDPVVWQRREYNKKADFIFNYTMDCQMDWQRCYGSLLADLDLGNVNWICHSDGGTRGSSCSAAGWIIEVVLTRDGVQYTRPVMMGGTYFSVPVSSFVAEAIALETVITRMTELIRRL